jgi:biotin synthase
VSIEHIYKGAIMTEISHLDSETARQLYLESPGELLEMAAAARQAADRNNIELCGIVNAKSGKCSENCMFCAQSAHYSTDIPESAPLDAGEVLSYARMLESYGVKRFSLVTSGKGITDKDLAILLPVYRMLKENTGLSLCASLGVITAEQMKLLKENGVSCYHHNLETGETFFPKICTTHTYEERLKTVRIALDVGLDVCCGGLIGLGESLDDRIELAFALRDLDIKSIPLNILMPVSGTPLGGSDVMGSSELMKTAALFRCVNPEATIRFAGGRPLFDVPTQMESLKKSFNGLMVGNYLTKKGLEIEADIERLKSSGFHIPA